LLLYALKRPQAHEIRSIARGPARFAFGVAGDVIFLCHQFGQMSWWDTCYTWHRVPRAERVRPPADPALHALLTVILVDATTGIVRALRSLTFSAPFTARLHQAIAVQAAHAYDDQTYQDQVNCLYARFTTEQLVARAIAGCQGGT
jgi:hypothetical protein